MLGTEIDAPEFRHRSPAIGELSAPAADEVCNKRHNEQDDKNPEQQARALHRHSGDTAEADRCGDQGHDEKYDGIVKQTEVRHHLPPVDIARLRQVNAGLCGAVPRPVVKIACEDRAKSCALTRNRQSALRVPTARSASQQEDMP